LDWLKENRKLTNWISKYKYPTIVLLVGLVFLLIPGKTESAVDTPYETQPSSSAPITATQELEQILAMIHGAGEVKVMLSVSQGEETIYQSDPQSIDEHTGLVEKNSTVIITDANRQEAGLVRQRNPQTYLGAIIVCQGGDDPSVCLAIVQAVSDVTGLGADQISVLKMK
jgi:stage III sporulation protein AG